MGVKFNPFTSKLDIVDSPSGEFSDIELALGTQTAPSLSFTGDPDTGIYSPGGDQVAISTGGTGRLFVDASGNVGIGQAPTGDQEASIRNSGFTALLVGSNNALGAMLALDGDSNGDGAGGDYSYIYHNPSGALEILQNSPSGTNEIQFKTAGQLRATLNSTGLGLGTSSPGTTLHVVGTTDGDAIRISQAGQVYKIGRRASDGALMFTGLQTQFTSFRFGTDGNEERVVFDPSGRVGIGTASPSYLLDVLGQARASSYLCGGGPGFTGYDFSTSGSGAGTANVFCPSGFTLAFGTNSTERARIDPSGRLLVGTSSESGNAKQVIRGNSGSSSGAGVLDIGLGATRPGGANIPLGYIRFTSTSNTSGNYHYAYIAAVSDGTSSSDADIPGRLVFATTADGASSPTERMRISSNGDISINGGSISILGDALGQKLKIFRPTNQSNIIALEVTSNVGGIDLQKFYVESDGDVYAVNTTIQAIASERRLKENIQPVDATDAWDTIKSVPYYQYNFIGDKAENIKYGPIADEVPTEMVVNTANSDEVGVIRTYNNAMLQARLYTALRVALSRIEVLEAEVAALKAS